MQIKNLEYLIALERAGSINKAAASMFISQQGLSKVLRSMESELGASLIERSSSGVRLTEAGKALLGHARSITREYDAALKEIEHLKSWEANAGKAPRSIELCVSPYVVLTLADRLSDVALPAMQATFLEMGNEHVAKALGAGDSEHLFLHDWVSETSLDPQRADAGTGEKTQRPGDVVTEVLMTSDLGILVRKDRKRPSIAREEVPSLPLVCFGGEDYHKSIQSALRVTSLPNVKMSLSNPEALMKELTSGRNPACAVADRHSFSANPAAKGALAFVPIEPAITLNVGFSYRADSPHAALFERCIAIWRKHLP